VSECLAAEARWIQSANTSILPKKQKLDTDEPATDEPAIDKPSADEPATEPTSLESTDHPAMVEPNTMETQGTSRVDTGRQGTDEIMVRSGIATTIDPAQIRTTYKQDISSSSTSLCDFALVDLCLTYTTQVLAEGITKLSITGIRSRFHP